jgi:large subunit ribosomal protein L19
MTEMIKAVGPKRTRRTRDRPGDTVSVHVRIKEGDRERIQEFRGTVIRLRKGGNNANFTVRRLASTASVSAHFLLRSPRIEGRSQRQAKVRRAQPLPATAVRQASGWKSAARSGPRVA